MNPPRRVLLDVNVFIIGLLEETSPDAKILAFLRAHTETVLLFSDEVENQLRRVGRRLKDKDWVGRALYLIWRDFTIDYVSFPPISNAESPELAGIPKEDTGIYLTALFGEADCFVSANHELVKQMASKQRVFECLTPNEFVDKYSN